jgi:hypothetical protein
MILIGDIVGKLCWIIIWLIFWIVQWRIPSNRMVFCNGMRARLERTLSGLIESKTDYTTGMCCFTITLAVLRCKGKVCYKWNCPGATSIIIQIQSSMSLTKRNSFVPWSGLTISYYLNLISVLLTYFRYYQNYPEKGDLSPIWLS